MSKPLWRWTVGPCTRQGFEILEESIDRTTNAFGRDSFDWMVCHNGVTGRNRKFLTFLFEQYGVQLHEQKWSDCAIPNQRWSPYDQGYKKIPIDGRLCGGTLWKICPGRLAPERHEIVCDNDLVILKALPQVQEFLDSYSKTLILEDPVRYFGQYDRLFQSHERYNSGLFGLPPAFDFSARIQSAWREHGQYPKLTQADEQGLLTYVLKIEPHVKIHREYVKELTARQSGWDYGCGYGYYDSQIAKAPPVDGKEHAIHFVQANRTYSHDAWNTYKEKNHI